MKAQLHLCGLEIFDAGGVAFAQKEVLRHFRQDVFPHFDAPFTGIFGAGPNHRVDVDWQESQASLDAKREAIGKWNSGGNQEKGGQGEYRHEAAAHQALHPKKKPEYENELDGVEAMPPKSAGYYKSNE